MNYKTTKGIKPWLLKRATLAGLCLALSPGLQQAYGQCAATTGTKTVGTGGDYTTLAAAFTDLSVNGFTGSVILELQTTYSTGETLPIVIPAFTCITGSNTITIRPAATIVTPIQFSATGTSVFTLNGASNIVLDGRPGGMGTTSMLSLNSNSNVVLLQTNALADTLRYLTITGNTTSNTSGMVHFASGSSNNLVSNCSFDKNATAMPASCITSSGTAGSPNNYNAISNNTFANFSGGTTSYGINASTNSNKFYIYNNSFYQTTANATGVFTTCINLGGDSMVVRSNYIGGNAPVAAGTWVSNATATSNAQRIIGVAIASASGNANPSLVDSNVITGFNFPSSYNTTSAGGCFSGIYISGTGTAKMGVNNGNFIGSMIANDVIKVVSSAASVNQTSYGYGVNGITCNTSGATIVANNEIGGLSIEGNAVGVSGVVLGIHNLNVGSGAKMTAINNTVGGTLQHSLRTGINGITTAAGNATGIRDLGAGTGIFMGNIIRNISAQGVGTNQSLAQGISLATANTAPTADSILNNDIYNIYSGGGNGCKGIKFESAPTYAVVIGNNIHDLEQANSNGTVGDFTHVGIFATNVSSGNLTVAYNTIQRILRTGTAPNADNTKGTIAGIAANGNAALKTYNNTIVLDDGANGPLTIGNNATGIVMSTANNTINNNLIKINANLQNAACLRNTASTTAAAPNTTVLSANNNVYSINARDTNYIYVQGSSVSNPGMGFFTCNTCATAANKIYDANFNSNCSPYKQFMAATGGRENASFTEDVTFAGGSVYPDNLQPAPTGASYAQNGGKALGYTTDILGNAVNGSTPDIGAIEFSSGSNVAGAGSPLANNSGATNTVTNDATATVSINNADCELITKITPSGGSPVAGNVTAQVWIDNGAGNYVRRHTQITPATNPATATATVTLYYTQQELNDYNATNPSALPMPTTPSSSDPNIPNIRVQKLSGTSSNGTGLPASYPSATPVTIVPSSVTWNADSLFWAVTFDVAGFSGFFLNTDPNPTPLPVNWITVNAQLNKANQAVISWGVNEKQVAGYDVQKSTDGRSFQSVGNVNSKGNGDNAYSLTEQEVLRGKAWYRIAQKGINGKVDYSPVMTLQSSAIYGQIKIYPNPATQILNIEVMQSDVVYSICDLQGKVVTKGALQSGKNTLNISNLSKGIYTIRIGETVQKIVLQ